MSKDKPRQWHSIDFDDEVLKSLVEKNSQQSIWEFAKSLNTSQSTKCWHLENLSQVIKSAMVKFEGHQDQYYICLTKRPFKQSNTTTRCQQKHVKVGRAWPVKVFSGHEKQN